MSIKVKCIDSDYSNGNLQLGTIYEVVSKNSIGDYELDGVSGSWLVARFEVVEVATFKVGDMVKCLDNVGRSQVLTIGYLYQVQKIVDADTSDPCLILKGMANFKFSLHSFRLATSATATTKISVVSPNVDVEEERCWKLLKPTIASDECCGGSCKKAMCWIHKDT